jgi:preprotein translocase subunit SecG
MTTLLSVIHVFVCLFLILVVLLQQGRGGGLGGAFGGTTQQVFGGRGAGNFMTRVTWACAMVFILTSVSLAYIASSGDRSLKARQGQSSGQKP